MVAGVFPTTIGCWVCDGIRCERVQICHCERVWTHGTKVLSLHKSASGNSFLIVHPQVPQFRPEQAFAMFERFIKDQPFWCCVPCAYFLGILWLRVLKLVRVLIWIIHESRTYMTQFFFIHENTSWYWYYECLNNAFVHDFECGGGVGWWVNWTQLSWYTWVDWLRYIKNGALKQKMSFSQFSFMSWTKSRPW